MHVWDPQYLNVLNCSDYTFWRKFVFTSFCRKLSAVLKEAKAPVGFWMKDRFLLLQSSIVDKTLMCPNLRYDKLEESIQNLGQC